MSERITQTQFIIAEALNNKGPLTLDQIMEVTQGRKQNVQDTMFRLSERHYVKFNAEGQYSLTRIGKQAILTSYAGKSVRAKRSKEIPAELPLWIKEANPEVTYADAPTIDRDEPVPDFPEDFFERLFEPTIEVSAGIVIDIGGNRLVLDVDEACELYLSLRKFVGPNGSMIDK
jgi:hypothetical protein